MSQKEDPVRGVDMAGVVEAVGSNVTRFAPGDAVFGGAPAAFAEYVRAREDRLVLKPRELSFEQAAAVGVAGRTALQGLRDVAANRSLSELRRVLAPDGTLVLAGADKRGGIRISADSRGCSFRT